MQHLCTTNSIFFSVFSHQLVYCETTQYDYYNSILGIHQKGVFLGWNCSTSVFPGKEKLYAAHITASLFSGSKWYHQAS